MSLTKTHRYAAPAALVMIVAFLTALFPPLRASADVLPTTPVSDGTGGPSTLAVPAPGADTPEAATTVELSTGSAQSRFPFVLAKARGDAQPSLALTYSSAAGVGLAGIGWTLRLPSIVRRGAAGMARFTDDVFTASPAALSDPNATFDEYLADGQLLVPICAVGTCTAGQIQANELLPASVNGWMYFRREVDDGARYFLSPDGQTWQRQEKSGHMTVFGHPLDSASVPAAFSDSIERPAASTNLPAGVSAATAVYRWNMVRESDASGNTVYYAWTDSTALAPGSTLPGVLYLSDVYDTLAVGQTPSLSAFAHHVHLTWQLSVPIPQPIVVPTPIWRAQPVAQLATVDVTSASWSSTARGLTRRYSLAYASNTSSTRNHLTGITLEGECQGTGGPQPVAEGTNGLVPNPSGCSGSLLALAQYGYYPDTIGGGAPAFSSVGTAFTFPSSTSPADILGQIVAGSAMFVDVNGDGAADFVSASDTPVTHFNAQSFLGSTTSVAFPSDASFTPCSLLPDYAVIRPVGDGGATDAGGGDGGDAGDGGTPFFGPAGCLGGGSPVAVGNGVAGSATASDGTSAVGSGASRGAAMLFSSTLGSLQGPQSIAQYPLTLGDWLVNGAVNWLTESSSQQWNAYTPTGGAFVGSVINVGSCQADPGCQAQRAFDVDGDGLIDQSPVSSNAFASSTYLTQRTHSGAIAPFSFVPPSWNGWTGVNFTTIVRANLGWSPGAGQHGLGGTPAGPSQFWQSMADMNGDGLPDTVLALVDSFDGVKFQTWLNHGDGTFGNGGAPSQPTLATMTLPVSATENVQGPCEAESAGGSFFYTCSMNHAVIRMGDVNGDGFADIVKLTSDQLFVCLQQGGPPSQSAWQCLATPLPAIPPVFPSQQACDTLDPGRSLLQIADIDGSGIPRILFSRYTAAVLIGSAQVNPACQDTVIYQTAVAPGTSASLGAAPSGAYPGLLHTVSRLGGAQDTIGYQPVRALPNLGGTIPVSAWVVTSIQTTNGIALPSLQSRTATVSYSYKTPVYDPRDKTFAGFQTVQESHSGDSGAPGLVRTSAFATTACGPPSSTLCTGQVDYGWVRALRGLATAVDERDANGTELKTTLNEYDEHHLYSGLDGRFVRKLPLVQQSTYLWDPGQQTAASTSTSFPFLNTGSTYYETASAGVGVLPSGVSLPAGAPSRLLEWDEDDLGNQTDTIDFGEKGVDTPIRTSLHSSLPPGDTTGWSYRFDSRAMGYTVDSAGATLQTPPARSYSYSYDSRGRLLTQMASVPDEPPPMGVPNFAAGAPPDATAAGPVCIVGCTSGSVSGIQYDAYGNATATPRANGRCSGVVYDALFAQLPQTTLAYQSGCGSTSPPPLATTSIYDRGLERVVQRTAPFSGVIPRVTAMRYDPFGRIVEVDQPTPLFPGAVDGHASLLVQYLNDAGPIRQVYTQTVDGTELSPVYQAHYKFVDGFGDTLAALDQATPGDSPVGQAGIVSGAHTRYSNGLTRQVYQPFYVPSATGSFSIDTYINAATLFPSASMTYDGAGRVRTRTDFNGAPTMYTYHCGAGIPPASGISAAASSIEVQDPEQSQPGGLHPSSFTVSYSDGHGRTTQSDQHLNSTATGGGDVITLTGFTATGEPNAISQTFPLGSYSRQMTYDSLGRMVSQTEPNVGTWSYAYNDSGDLVGIMDARACGKVVYHDALGRVTAEDYSPCEPSQPGHSPPNLTTGDGTEAFNVYDGYGELAHAYDQAQHSDYTFDGRGRATTLRRQIATPSGSATLATRYAPHVYTKGFIGYSEANRPLTTTTGTDLPVFASHGLSTVTASYSLQGTLAQATSSYGTLIASQVVDAAGRPLERLYGDAAVTEIRVGYDNNGALIAATLERDPGPWVPLSAYAPSPPPPPGQTTQSELVSIVIGRDMVGNPTSMTQNTAIDGVPTADGNFILPAIVPAEWPTGAAPTTSRVLTYGDDYRLQRMQTQYTGGDDTFTSPYTPADGSTYPTPAAVTGGNRVRDQSYTYDGRGNVQLSTDNANVFFDRSIGDISNQADRITAAGTHTGYGTLSTSHDESGNLTGINIASGSTYAYAWDELGRLASATRTDPGGVQVVQEYAYDASGQRVRITTQNSSTSATQHTLQVFDSLVLKNAAFPDSGGLDYQHDATTEHLYLKAGGLTLGHVFEAQQAIPSVSAGSPVHMFMTLRDPLGSTAFVIDHDSSELVEAATYHPYGAVESDYRPARWGGFREDVRYTGHWDDAEVGLVYMNARYYSPQLHRFISPDPQTIHGVAGDLNPYAYGGGSPMRYMDPLGLYGCDSNSASCPDTSAFFTPSGDTSSQPGNSNSSAPNGTPAPTASQPLMSDNPDAGTPAEQQYDLQYGGDLSAGTTPIPRSMSGDEQLVQAVGIASMFVGAGEEKLALDFAAEVIEASEGIEGAAGTIARTADAIPATFIGQESGPSIIVPGGATGPTPALNGAGVRYTGGAGGPGLDARVTDLRIMDATDRYPGGYASYSNAAGQTVNPLTGQTIAPANPWWHIVLPW